MRPRFALFHFLTVLFSVVLMASSVFGTTRAPEFPSGLQWINVTRPLTLQDLRGKVVLLDFWTYCCINCIQILPDLEDLEQKFGDKLVIIGVHSGKFENEKKEDAIRSAVLRYGITHPVVNDASYTIWDSYAVRAWPTLVVLDKEGYVREQVSGEGKREHLERTISSLLEEEGSSLEEKNRGQTKKLPLLKAANESSEVLSFPGKIAVSDDGRFLAVSDSGHHQVLLIERGSGAVLERIGSGRKGKAQGTLNEAEFFSPQGVLFRGNQLFVADTGNHQVRQIDLTTKTVSLFAGDGKRGAALSYSREFDQVPSLASPWDLALFEETLIVANAGTHQLLQFDIHSRKGRVLAGNGNEALQDGEGSVASFAQPSGLSVRGTTLYVADSEASALRAVTLPQGEVSTLIGEGLFDFGLKDGAADIARMQHPLGVLAQKDGVLVVDTYNSALRKYSFASKVLSTLHFTEPFHEPSGITEWKGNFYLTDTNAHQILRLEEGKTTVSPLVVDPVLAPSQKASLVAAVGKPIHLEWSFHLPKGYELNSEAPSTLEYSEEDKLKKLPVTTLTPQVTLSQFQNGEDRTVNFSGTLYYCTHGKEALCLIERIKKSVSFTSHAEKGKETLHLEYQVMLPKAP